MKAVHDVLPSHLLSKIFESIDTKERARLGLICQTWRAVLADGWVSISLSFTTLRQLEDQRKWLDMLAAKGAKSVRSIEMQWRGGKLLHPAAGSLHVDQFINLEKLHLKPPDSAYWAINSKAVKSLRPLTRLKELILVYSPCRRSNVPPIISLEQFAIFPELQLLSIMLQPCRGWEAGWQIDVSPALAGLKKLKDLTLLGGQSLVISRALIDIFSRLQKLDLHIREPLDQETCLVITMAPLFDWLLSEDLLQILQTPNLEALRFICSPAECLPFSGFTNLLDLQFNGTMLQSHFFSMELSSLQSLHLGYCLECVDAAFVKKLTQLKNLRDLSIMFYSCPEGQETLAAFSALTRLERLHLDFVVDQTVLLTPAPCLSSLKYLTELQLSSHVNLPVTLGDGIQNLPALKSLHVEAEYFGAALSSPTVTRLCLEGTCGFSMKSCPSLAEFPALKRLELKLMPDLEKCTHLAAQLATLPQLKELLLVKGYAPAQHYSLDIPWEPCGTFERLLASLNQIASLEVVQVAAINDYVGLSRMILPPVKHLSLACRGIAVCTSCFNWTLNSLNLVFCNASQSTLDILQHNTDLSASFEQSIRLDVWKAKLTKKGTSPYEFGADLFDDFIESQSCYEDSCPKPQV